MTGPVDVTVATGQGPAVRRRGRVLLAAGVVAALVVTAVVAFRWGSDAPAETVAPQPSASTEGVEKLTVAQVYETLLPSVVSIRARAATGSAGSSGTGLIVNSDGVILTALHVVQDAGSIELTFADGTRSEATVIAASSAIDIALLAAESLPSVVVPAVLGGSGLSVGDDVVAIGDQLGLTRSTTAGVVSGLGRSVPRPGAGDLQGLIQFDAAVNPGSSGGPLVNTRGETVGIVVALANPTDAATFIGIGFAVPIGSAVAAGGGQGPQL